MIEHQLSTPHAVAGAIPGIPRALTETSIRDVVLGNDLSSMHVSRLGRRGSVWQAHDDPKGAAHGSDVRLHGRPGELARAGCDPTRMEKAR